MKKSTYGISVLFAVDLCDEDEAIELCTALGDLVSLFRDSRLIDTHFIPEFDLLPSGDTVIVEE